MYKYPDRRADRKISSIFSNLCHIKRSRLCIENTKSIPQIGEGWIKIKH
ncbi:hypothetical protein MtrunA17_Chr5g0396671 [Medicago truncatula]|uniref:Uncharacterized protein n=1 Tax=Medicago truncatula TaxID=3880 RepID=A0A396HQ89_MEDTR|nr:hypothetical protein MtrunA17_Chr5g0396671 [Medicago truncatula]